MRRGVWLLAVVLVSGCASGSEPSQLVAGEGPIASLLAPGPPWRVEGDDPAWIHPGARVALGELGVELVEEKWRLPGPLSWNPLMFTPFPSMLGISVREAVYPPELQEALPDQLRACLQRELDARGVEWVPLPRPALAHQLRGLSRSECIRSERLPMADDPFKDVGLTRRVLILAPRGMTLLEGDADRLRASDRALLIETGAEVVLRVRLRVGVSDDRAALEAGSRIDWTTREAQGTLRARRSLIGEGPVVTGSSFVLLRGYEESVETAPFAREVEQLFPRYLGLALEAAR